MYNRINWKHWVAELSQSSYHQSYTVLLYKTRAVYEH